MRLQFPTKVQVTAPLEADQMRVEKLELDFLHQTCLVIVQLIDTDGQGPGQPALVDRRPVTMGLGVLMQKTDTKKLEKEVLEVLSDTQTLPSGGTIEE